MMKYLSAMHPFPIIPVVLSLVAAVLPLYQVCGQMVPPGTDAGKTSIAFENEPFANHESGDGGAGFVKFSIVLTDPGSVYFQDSNRFPFHYNFATAHLEPFVGMSASQFDAVSLRRSGQQVVLGAVIIPPSGGPREFGVQFVGLDAYPKEDVKAWFNTVKAAVSADPAATAVYIPSFEQKAQAESDRAWFEAEGIPVDGIERWIRSDAIYSEGWAFGRLVFVPGAEIENAYKTGALKPTDVLLTDGVPAEVPFVAGILSLAAATPNSHVAILARNQRVPFAWISRNSERERLEPLIGREVLIRAGTGTVRFSAADDDLSDRVRSQILKLKEPPKVSINARKPYGALSADVTALTPKDIKFFGGKAANFGLLRRTIPERSPKAIAFSFDLWDQFLGNVNPDSGLTLRAEIEQRLGGFTYPPDMPVAAEALDDVRDLIRKKVKFTDAQKSAILSALTGAGFQTTRMLRFRSSSNVEDTEHLSGAGLYESFNGCIADSLDGNDTGPCGCAPEEPDEKTVLSAIEKVFASFYNDNAWLERLRFGIKESQVGMAVLVHENAPDADEMANGVVTITRRRDATSAEFEWKIVSQVGATSVTNPEGGANPEVVLGGQSGAEGDPFVYTQQHSDLVPLGANVMDWEADYHELASLLVQVAEGYAKLFPARQLFALDLEFKKLQPGQLQVKQVRELAQPEQRMVTPVLLNEPTEFVVHQTEFGDAFAFHRLKCMLSAETGNLKLAPAALSSSVKRKVTFDFINDDGPAQLTNGLRGFPGYRFSRKGAGVHREQWKADAGRKQTIFRLRTTLPTKADAEISPVLTQRDCTHTLTALYRTPQPYLDFVEGVKMRTSDAVTLIPRESLVPEATAQTRRIQTIGGVTVDPLFYWPDYSDAGNTIIKTFPLAAWEKSTITGLTTQPLVLTNEFAQTYAPGHHNFTEVFLYEPALDPAVTPAQRTELENANIRLIHVYHDRMLGGDDVVRVIGFDGEFRTLN